MYSTQVGDMRGKVGGAVHSTGRFGSFIRRKVSPTQPRSSSQMNVRANFTALSKLWSSASMANYRAAWIALAASYPVKNVFGQAHNLTGLQLFLALNRGLNNIGGAVLLIPPATLNALYPGALTLAKSGGPPITTLTVQPATYASATEATVIDATPGISPGRATAAARFRQVHMVSGVQSAPIDIFAKYVTKFGTPIIGRQIFIRTRYITIATGAQSLPSEAAITI
jgi:hypothetical protein